jgi:probable HAF family extracellular repeat protein
MNSQKSCLTATLLLAALALPVRPGAQEHDKQEQDQKHTNYKLVDVGTFGGPASGVAFNSVVLNSRGMVVGAAATPTLAPAHFNPFPCGPNPFVYHGFEWQNDVVSDLGALPGTDNCSNAQWINEKGDLAGNSENGEIDPLTGVTEIRAVLWKDGRIRNLGTLGGNHSAASTMNNRGQVVGFAQNNIPDIYSLFDYLILFLPGDIPCSSCGTETRAFLWQQGQMLDLGTLGGPDAWANAINDRGQIVGFSYTDLTPIASTGLPTIAPFLWDDGKMVNLGSFGGHNGQAALINNRGQVLGASNLPGDQSSHFFIWERGKLTDLSTPQPAGSMTVANWIDDSGEVVGALDTPGTGQLHAARWINGVLTDLGTLPGDCASEAFTSNSRGQIGGVSISCDGNTWHAFLWEKGSIVDLNTRIPSNSSLQLVYAVGINDQGEIAGNGVPPGVSTAPPTQDTMSHAFVLIPCDGDNADGEDCQHGDEGGAAVTQSHPSPVNQTFTAVAPGNLNPEMLAAIRARLARRFPYRGLGPVPRN